VYLPFGFDEILLPGFCEVKILGDRYSGIPSGLEAWIVYGKRKWLLIREWGSQSFRGFGFALS